MSFRCGVVFWIWVFMTVLKLCSRPRASLTSEVGCWTVWRVQINGVNKRSTTEASPSLDLDDIFEPRTKVS